jgi:hypothetical protein
VDYVVRPLPSVTALLASAERSVQNEFQRLLAIVAMNPFPSPQFPLITEDTAADGSRFFTYSDDRFPYAIQFVVFEPDRENLGLIVVIDLMPC